MSMGMGANFQNSMCISTDKDIVFENKYKYGYHSSHSEPTYPITIPNDKCDNCLQQLNCWSHLHQLIKPV